MEMKTLALEGIKIVDLTEYLAGPYCTMLLADLGADVVKVERPDRGDGSRQWGPPFIGGESAYFLSVNRNKRSVALDLKSNEGREALLKLLADSDVLIENYRPGVARSLGIGYEQVKEINSRLVYCSISGFGQDGPYRERPSYDIIGQAMGGLMSITGEGGNNHAPVKVGIAIADICAGMFAAVGILAALNSRHATGLGQRIDVSLLDGMVSWLSHQAGYYFATGRNPERLGSAHPTIAPYQAFQAGDGEYFVLAVGNDSLWERFCAAVNLAPGDPRFAKNYDRVRNRGELVALLEVLFQTKGREEWIEIIQRAGVPCAPALTLEQVFNDPQVLARGMVQEVSHQKAGKIRVVGSPLKMSGSPPFSIRYPPPLLGENTRELIGD